MNKRQFLDIVGQPVRKAQLNGELPHWFWDCRDGTVQAMVVHDGDELWIEIVSTTSR